MTKKSISLKDVFTACKIIVVASSKGGVGKSTIAVNLAVGFACDGNRVALIDGEEDGTTCDWESQRDDLENLTIINGFEPTLPKMLNMYRNMFDVIVVDTAGVNATLSSDGSHNIQVKLNQQYLCQSDMILIPVPPSPVDIRKSVRFISAIENYVDASQGGRQALCVLNKIKLRQKLSTEALSYRDSQPFGAAPFSSVFLRQSENYKHSESNFKTVDEYDPSHYSADDMRALRLDVVNRLADK